MTIVAWLIAGVMAVLAGYLALRKQENPYPDTLARLLAEVENGEEIAGSKSTDPAEVAQLRQALSQGWKPIVSSKGDPGEAALNGLVRYLSEAVLAPLSAFQQSARAAVELEPALNALEDLSFYAGGAGGEEEKGVQNLSAVIQKVTREYALETGVPVKFRGPSGPVQVKLAPEGFKDALFLVMANAGRFSDGQTVEVALEKEDDRVLVRVRDRGTGFSKEALDQAFDPFWTTDSDALGLGLTHARRLIERQGGQVRIQNVEGKGGEVLMILPGNR